MSNWAGGVLTAAGRVLQAKVEAGTTALILTKIKLGDGTEGMDAVDNLTDLVGPKAVLGISSSVADGDHATITGVMLSTQLQAGFWCREWGLFATDPDAGEILYMVTIDAQPEWLPASTAAAQVSATYAMNIAVANATNIEVQIDPAGLVDVEMLENFVGVPGRSKAIALGTTGMLENLPAGWFLECTTAGTTGATTPVITSPTVGGTVNDGSVVWTIRNSASTQDLTNYLPLAGGEMVVGAKISQETDASYIKINAGRASSDDETGITINGKSRSFAGGHIRISSIDNSDLACEIISTSTGLEWLKYTSYSNNQFTRMDLGGNAIVAKNLIQNGYIKLASGEIRQWGLTDSFLVGETYKDITLPLSFINGFCSVVAIQQGAPTNGVMGCEILGISKFRIHRADSQYSNNSGCYWLAVGY